MGHERTWISATLSRAEQQRECVCLTRQQSCLPHSWQISVGPPVKPRLPSVFATPLSFASHFPSSRTIFIIEYQILNDSHCGPNMGKMSTHPRFFWFWQEFTPGFSMFPNDVLTSPTLAPSLLPHSPFILFFRIPHPHPHSLSNPHCHTLALHHPLSTKYPPPHLHNTSWTT